MMEDFKGLYDIEFVGSSTNRRIPLDGATFDMHGRPVYLSGRDKRTYNWSTIISVRKVM